MYWLRDSNRVNPVNTAKVHCNTGKLGVSPWTGLVGRILRTNPVIYHFCQLMTAPEGGHTIGPQLPQWR